MSGELILVVDDNPVNLKLACALLKADPATQNIVIVALTAYAMKGDEQKAREAGCNGYIPKPIETRTFIKMLTRFLAAPQEENDDPSAT